MKIIDITGNIYTGMWSMGPPFPEYGLKETETPEWLEYKVYSEIFEGLFSQTGTYLETPAHLLGYEKSYPLIDVDVARLVDLDTYVIKLDYKKLPVFDDRPVITLDALKSNFNKDVYKKKGCRAIFVSTGWGENWRDKGFVESSPFLKFDAMHFLMDQKPFLLGADSPRWENLVHPEGFFPDFFAANILMLGPCVNLEKIKGEVVKLTALPIKIEGTCCTPCRAIVKDELE
jgi:kynurenine formamidase